MPITSSVRLAPRGAAGVFAPDKRRSSTAGMRNTAISKAELTQSGRLNPHAAAAKFQTEVDSAVVYHNASTRFTDGGELGLGAEIGISTQKLHARGPMALPELTTYKYLINGFGQTRP